MTITLSRAVDAGSHRGSVEAETDPVRSRDWSSRRSSPSIPTPASKSLLPFFGARRRASSHPQPKHASARATRCRAACRHDSSVVAQVTSGFRPRVAHARVGSVSYNDPLNKTDPLGLRPCDMDFTLDGKCITLDKPMPTPTGLEQIYVLSWPLFRGRPEEAGQLRDRMLKNPNDYFPFTVQVKRCARTCDPPISEGNILWLSGDNYSAGHVQVIDVNSLGFKFLALDDHIAAGGTVQFVISATQTIGKPDNEAMIELEVIAYGAGRGVEGKSPGWLAEHAGRQTWSRMVAAIQCEHIYQGQEQYRRC